MASNNNNLINKIEVEEKRARKRMLTYASVPLLLTIILVIISYMVINNAGEEVKELKHEKSELEANIKQLNTSIGLKSDSIAEMKKVMELALNYSDKRYEFNYSVDKELYSRYPRQTEMLSEIRAMIRAGEVKWKLGGSSPEDGFDSPSFASFMINRHSAITVEAANRYQLRDALPKTETPRVGDIVFYEHGYAMFYFEYRNKPFVIGMTPLGLASLTYDFGPKRLGFGRVSY
ncbi:hypothetical protein [uncultured Draconibacterium sp.]|uniref:hypothetical protein n=1 Tax=uncultured Draconibacterium sp. TaxID=1573823 RepID=UPI0025EC88DD|nr:hypothetical protein [uncultured Draconibacterium sp.]